MPTISKTENIPIPGKLYRVVCDVLIEKYPFAFKNKVITMLENDVVMHIKYSTIGHHHHIFIYENIFVYSNTEFLPPFLEPLNE